MSKKKSAKVEKVEVLELEEEKVEQKEKPVAEKPKAQEKKEEKVEPKEIQIMEPIVVKKKKEYVKVIPMVDMRNVYIGGTYYNFKKGVEQRVLEDVERVLRERDLIK